VRLGRPSRNENDWADWADWADLVGTPAVENLNQHLDVGGEEAESRTTETPVFEKFNPLLHGGVTTTSGRGANKRKEVLSIAFVKKYIQYAKSRCHPVLTKGAADWIVNVYSALRNDDLASNQKRVSTSILPRTCCASAEYL
jgi:DNA replication licensing factor MCM3